MKRILRVIEYTGTDEFLNACIEKRQVKGTMTVPNGCIREAILGDVPEILTWGDSHRDMGGEAGQITKGIEP